MIVTTDAALVLSSGKIFPGVSCGYPLESIADLHKKTRGVGDVIFNTGMTGYPEILTDPSYTGQIVVMTAAHIGNYGIDARWSQSAHTSASRQVSVRGFIMHKLYQGSPPFHRMRLDIYLKEQGVSALSDVDTRSITQHLRDNGEETGVIVKGSLAELRQHLPQIRAFLQTIPSMEGMGFAVGIDEVKYWGKESDSLVALIDCGVKSGILQELQKRNFRVLLVPSTMSAEEILHYKPRALVVSNGPGDPAVVSEKQVASCIGKIPILGICFGHQIIARALGARTYKMKFGHHGLNQAIRDESTGKVYVSSENHGFAVDETSLPKGVEVWFRNTSDKTVEGIRNKKEKLWSVQFHPEASPGPQDMSWVFDKFLENTDA